MCVSPQRHVRTCSRAHAPRRQAVWRGEAVEDADVLRRKKLHKLGVLEDVPFAVQDVGSLVGNIDNPARVERHRYRKDVLEEKKAMAGMCKEDN